MTVDEPQLLQPVMTVLVEEQLLQLDTGAEQVATGAAQVAAQAGAGAAQQ